MADKTPRYNLGVVIRETGIKPDTLRAWERRYGLPEPNRTEGGHRLYSEYDIEMIKWLINRQEEGMRISNVVQLWEALVEEGQDPVLAQSKEPEKLPVADVSGLIVAELREKWLDACLAFDESRAEFILTQAFARYPLETVCIEILQKGLAQMGMLWFENKASVQQEHFTSALAVRRLNALISAAPTPEHPEKTILACVPGEYHSFPVLMMTLMLRYNGWHIINLGQNVPFDRMQQTIQSVKADLTILCAMTLETAGELLDMVNRLKSEKPMIAYGGLVFSRNPQLTRRIPAHYLGNELEKVHQRVEYLLKNRPPCPKVEPMNGEVQAALQNFREQHLRINARVMERMYQTPLLRNFVDYTDVHLSRKIQSALTFGQMDLIESEIDEIRALIEHYGYPADAMTEYLQIYHQELQNNLDERGELITRWFADHLEKAG